jgi:hypothetical protein
MRSYVAHHNAEKWATAMSLMVTILFSAGGRLHFSKKWLENRFG